MKSAVLIVFLQFYMLRGILSKPLQQSRLPILEPGLLYLVDLLSAGNLAMRPLGQCVPNRIIVVRSLGLDALYP